MNGLVYGEAYVEIDNGELPAVLAVDLQDTECDVANDCIRFCIVLSSVKCLHCGTADKPHNLSAAKPMFYSSFMPFLLLV
jgi:hypothetical protein